MITSDIQRAARALTQGDLVAFPSETVYGLGADALRSDVVAKIFARKGRPSNNPLIVHVNGVEMARTIVSDWPEEAQRLADAFWPGPLTLVLPKNDRVPDNVTGGGDTVAIRMPDHERTLELIRAFGGPLVGPSANRSGTISPTTAQHVEASLGEDLLILDGGPCTRGIESTVVRLSTSGAEILRPGVIGADELSRFVTLTEPMQQSTVDAPLPSPGLLTRHYAPRTETRLLETISDAPKGAVVLSLSEAPEGVRAIRMPDEASAYASRLYAALREADSMGADLILVESPQGKGPIWDAVRDRLRRASASNRDA